MSNQCLIVSRWFSLSLSSCLLAYWHCQSCWTAWYWHVFIQTCVLIWMLSPSQKLFWAGQAQSPISGKAGSIWWAPIFDKKWTYSRLIFDAVVAFQCVLVIKILADHSRWSESTYCIIIWCYWAHSCMYKVQNNLQYQHAPLPSGIVALQVVGKGNWLQEIKEGVAMNILTCGVRHTKC